MGAFRSHPRPFGPEKNMQKEEKIMSTLYPQNNAARMVLDLGGMWDFRFQGDEEWQPIAVPASYNDQSPDPRFRKAAGVVEYRRKITIPAGWKGMRV